MTIIKRIIRGYLMVEVSELMDQIFDSSTRSDGRYAGVFEFDGEVAYFYLYRIRAGSDGEIVGAIPVKQWKSQYTNDDLSIFWSDSERLVSAAVCGVTCATFDVAQPER